MLNQDFLSGNYQKAASRSFDQVSTIESIEIPGLVGSLSFTGKDLEAKHLYKESFHRLSDTEKSACRFFLGLGHTRKSQYKKASRVFRNNLRSLNSESTSHQKFYVYQGIAFYLFFLGKFKLSRKWALKSFDSALEAGDLYGRSLSTDLLAHIKLRLGEVNGGLELLREAKKISHKIKNKSVAEAIEIAELQYQAQYGFNKSTQVSVLEGKFNSLVSEDNYSRAAIGLELARQYTLRGKFQAAEKILESISANIFATENRRQEIQLNLRFAENFYQIGKEALAWNYLRSARRCLNFEADKSFEVQIMGFEYKLFEGDAKDSVKKELKDKSRIFNTIINQNILSRNKIIDNEGLSREDLYHDFLLSLDQESDKVSAIIESGYYSLLANELEIKRGESLLYVDTHTHRVIAFSQESIEIPQTHLTPTDLKILLSLLSGKNEKEEICKTVWGYKYDPLRHDNIIYTAIRSLRKNLGNCGSWIETSESGYHLRADRKFKVNSKNEFKKSAPMESSLIETDSEELNLRQIKSLQYLKKHESLDVAAYQKLFKVSDVTASRDLRSLKKLGYVVTIGQARAIKYLLAMPI